MKFIWIEFTIQVAAVDIHSRILLDRRSVLFMTFYKSILLILSTEMISEERV